MDEIIRKSGAVRGHWVVLFLALSCCGACDRATTSNTTVPAAAEPAGSNADPAHIERSVPAPGDDGTFAPTGRLHRPLDLAPGNADVVEDHAVLMGTPIEILVVTSDRDAGERAIAAALVEMARVEQLISSWRPESQISALNRVAGKAPVQVDAEVLDLLEDAVSLCKLTRGKFDVTFKGAGDLWDFRSASPRPPSADRVAAALERINCRALELDRDASTAFLTRPNMAVGLGGIGKGYAVDRAVAVMRELGVQDFVVNAGGDLYGAGRYKGRLWQVAVRHPRREGLDMALIPMSNLAVATSGDYEQFFEVGGQRYHHILDPSTGYPAMGCQSVTVVAPAAYLADALATGVFVLGPVEGMALVEELEGIEAAIVDAQGRITRSSGLQGGSIPP